jgi:DDE family transposase
MQHLNCVEKTNQPVKKQQYRARNRKDYNKALIDRGSLTLWFDKHAINLWLNEQRSGKRGRPLLYAPVAIKCMLTIKAVYHLPLRSTQGLMHSVMKLLKLDLPVADYSTLSERSTSLEVKLPRQATGKALHIVIDSTGMKVYGEGEWKVRQHGYSKRRTWRKLHLGVDQASSEILAVEMTDHETLDRRVMPALIEHVEEPLTQVSADGAYDYKQCYQAIAARAARATIPPRADARMNGRAPFADRDENIRRIAEVGRKAWKQECGYHRRSLAETAVLRVKTIFGDKLAARKFTSQAVELKIKGAALNRMTSLGMPESYAI